jgi:hypothetical protein
MTLPVKLQDVIDALELTSDFNSHFLDRRTGEIEMITDEVWRAAENDELLSTHPDWERELILKAREIQSTDHFVELPGKFEINSYEMMERFSHEHPNGRISQTLSYAIRGKGAFRRFREKISDLGIEDEWNRFEHQQFEELAVQWLEAEGIPFTREDEIQLSAEM